MKKWKLIIATLTLVTIAGGAWFTAWANTPDRPLTATVQPIQQPQPQPPTVDEFFALTNEARSSAGVKPLALDTLLNQSAQRKADELARDGWDNTPHVNNEGVHGYMYIPDTGKKCISGSENLLYGVTTARIGVNWWMNSEAHKNALLSPAYESVGFGINGGYVVQHFCDER